MNKKYERGCCCGSGRDETVKREVEGGERRRIGGGGRERRHSKFMKLNFEIETMSYWNSEIETM
jgi:hypothetical protein